MPYSYQIYTGNGSAATFSVPFPYLSKAHVSVKVNNATQTFTWDSSSVVRLAVAPASGAVVEVRRDTPKSGLLVDFQDGGVLTESNLDTQALQNLYIAQEALDASTDAVDYAKGLFVSTGNTPPPTSSDIGKVLRATATGKTGWSDIWTDTVPYLLNMSGIASTGNIVVTRTLPSVEVNKTLAGSYAQLIGKNAGLVRWVINLGDNVTEIGGNYGSRFTIQRHSDTGGYIDVPFAIERQDGRASFSLMPRVVGTPIVPPGVMWDYAGGVVPSGWLLCDGRQVSRVTYADLFAAIGTTYGAGDGSTTFNLPDARGRVTAGQDNMGGTPANRLTAAISNVDGATLGATGGDQRLQTHDHTITDPGHFHTGTTDAAGAHSHNLDRAVLASGGTGGTGIGNPFGSLNIGTDVQGNHSHTFTTASKTTGITVNTAGGGSSQNVQPTLVVNKIIKT